MKTKVSLLILGVMLTPLAMHAQGGCIDSPENPTGVLGLVGSAAAVLFYLRARRSSRR